MERRVERLPKKMGSDITDACMSHDFNIRGLLDFSQEEEKDFIVRSLRRGYDEARTSLLEIGDIDIPETGSMLDGLSILMSRARKIERKNVPMLEKCCLKLVTDTFSIPEDTIVFSMKIEDMLKDTGSILQLEPEDSEVEYDDYSDVRRLKFEVGRRHINNMMVAGAAQYYTVSMLFMMYDDGKIDKETLVLYLQILSLNDFLLFSEGDIKITEKDKKEAGYVSVVLGDEDHKTFIEAKGSIFPILLYETVKGVFELISSHALPDERRKASAVIKKTDCVENEVWYMRLGFSIWDNMRKCLDGIPSEKIPYVMSKVFSLPRKRYISLMKEVMNGTRKAERMMKNISSDIEYDEFIDRMSVKKNDKNIIQDEYIHPEEL